MPKLLRSFCGLCVCVTSLTLTGCSKEPPPPAKPVSLGASAPIESTEPTDTPAKSDDSAAPVKPADDDVTVKTLVKEGNRKPIAIDYRMSKAAGGWMVYDVVVENLSLVTNYRGTFNTEVGKSGIDGLIKALEAKNKSNAEG